MSTSEDATAAAVIPLSFGQRRLWFVDRVQSAGWTYNVAITTSLRGALNIDALEDAVNDVLARHEVLRTVFPERDGSPVQHILPFDRRLVRLAVSEVPAHEADGVLEALAWQPFDLTRDLLIRAALVTVAPGVHLLYLVMHHIVVDGWSVGPLMRDLATAYNSRSKGSAPGWPDLPVQYADFAVWQRDTLGTGDSPEPLLAEQLTFWRQALAGLPEEIVLPADRARSTIRTYRGGAVDFALDAEMHRGLLDLARRSRASLFIVLHAALSALFSRLGAGDDIPIGTGVSDRPDESLAGLVGFFVSTLVLRTDVSGDPTFQELIARVRRFDLEAFSNRDVPFELVVEKLGPGRRSGLHPLFQTILSLQDSLEFAVDMDGLDARTAKSEVVEGHAAKFDLNFDLYETRDLDGRPAGIDGKLKFATDLWDVDSAQALAGHLQQMLRLMLDDPDLPVSRAALLSAPDTGGRTAVAPSPGPAMEELFERRARVRSDAVAVEFAGRHLSARDLDVRAERLASRLRMAGVGAGGLVAVLPTGALDDAVARLAVWKIDADCVRADRTSLPALISAGVVIEAMVSSADSPAVRNLTPSLPPEVTLDGFGEVLPSASSPQSDLQAGSTDRRDGRRPVMSRLPHRLRQYVLSEEHVEGETWLWTGGQRRDGVTAELWWAVLAGGGTWIVAPDASGPSDLAELITEHHVSAVVLSAETLSAITTAELEPFGSVDQVVRCGEHPSGEELTSLTTVMPNARITCVVGVDGVAIAAELGRDPGGGFVPGPLLAAADGLKVLDHRLGALPPGLVGDVYVTENRLADGAAAAGLDAGTWFPDPCDDGGRRIRWVGLRARMLPGGLVRIVGPAQQHTTRTDDLLRPSRPKAATPRTARQQILCGIISEVLNLKSVSIHDDFFDLGGHSLAVARVAGRIQSVLNVDLGLSAVFRTPTVAALDASIVASHQIRARPLPIEPRPDRIPLSPAQQRVWTTEQMQGPGSSYNVPIAVTLRGDLDVSALAAALVDVLARHEMLRTVLRCDRDGPYQCVTPMRSAELVLEAEECEPEAVAGLLRAHARYIFDLAEGPLIRTHLIRVAPDSHVLLLVLHHVAFDGWSLVPLMRDLSTAYAARSDDAAPVWGQLPVQYADYALWQRQILSDDLDTDGLLARQITYWERTLAGIPEQVRLPADRVRRGAPSMVGEQLPVRIDAATHEGLAALARRHNVTMFMVLHAAFVVLLSRLGAGTDVPIGATVAGRTNAAFDDLIGFFTNTLVLRTDLSGDPSVGELLNRIRETDLAAFDNQETPFELLVERLKPTRSEFHHPLFQVMLVLQNNEQGELNLPGLQTEIEDVSTGTAKFDLTLSLQERFVNGVPAGIEGVLEYATDLFDQSTADLLMARLLVLIDDMVACPAARVSQLEILAPGERSRLVRWSGSVVREFPAERLHEIFEERVAERPDASAVVFESGQVTYAELNGSANRLAHHLDSLGIRQGALVGICLGRGPELVASLLAALKVGAAYTLLDPTLPAQRIADVLEETRATVVITSTEHERLAGEVPTVCLDREVIVIAANPETDVDSTGDADDPACVMFTSGSTGRPTGILSPHRALVSTYFGQNYCRFGTDEVFLQCSPVSWDGFALELFGVLLHGGTCVLQPGQVPDPPAIEQLVRSHGVTMLQLSATLFNYLVDEHPAAFQGVAYAITGGEPASPAHVAKVHREYPALNVVNGYGPAESMGFTTSHHVQPRDLDGGSIPIGVAVANKQTLLLGPDLELVPCGVVGELYAAGAGLAHGYLGQAGPTAERFVANPYGAPGERMYRTGDLARWTRDGTLEYFGRRDDQLKVRGFRVEPAEIEATLAKHASVAQVRVLAGEGTQGDLRLIAYVVLVPGSTADAKSLRTVVEAVLPYYMVPSVFVTMDSLPFTANGKLDRSALPAPGPTVIETVASPPRTDLEKMFCHLFDEVLEVDGVGAHDDFFDLGGHSLDAVRLVTRIRAGLGLAASVADVFAAPTVAELAQRLQPTDAPATHQ